MTTKEYWQSIEGKCQGCGAEIAKEDQYCPACTEFLIEATEEHEEIGDPEQAYTLGEYETDAERNR